MASEIDVSTFIIGELSDIKQQLSELKLLVSAIRRDRFSDDPLALGGSALEKRTKGGYSPLDEQDVLDSIRGKAKRRGWKRDKRTEQLASSLKVIWQSMLGDAATYSDDMFYETARSSLASYAFEDDEIICSALHFYLRDGGDAKPSILSFKRNILSWINKARIEAVSDMNE